MKMAVANSNQLIKENMKAVASYYQQIRGCKREEIISFWDCVVLTTADEDQTKLYEYVIERKIANGTFPKNLPYFVYADLPGPKIGSGGSILYSLTNLFEEWKENLYQKKIIIICVGGQSQRLPTGTFLGKLSLNLPSDEFQFDMLDLKLAMYLPFVERMKPGVFVTCSDDVETYSGLNDLNWNFDNEGFTALGHLSSVQIGCHHGVYVLNLEEKSLTDDVVMSQCHRVLQKPSLQLMKDSGAILPDGRVCTDSAFFFDHNISRKCVKFMSKGRRILTEIDAYKHFLQPLGKNPEMCPSDESAMVHELFSLLKGTNINVILLTKSNFYHLGTMVEYLENLTLNSDKPNDFFDEMNLSCLSNSKCEGILSPLKSHPTILHSIIGSDVDIRFRSVVEWSRVNSGTSIGSGCIISHCDIDSNLILPSGICFHTVAVVVRNNQSVEFTTLAFSIDDDLKIIANEIGLLKYLGVDLGKVCKLLELNTEEIFPDFEKRELSLWKVKLFPVAKTMRDSFKLTLFMVNRILGRNENREPSDFQFSRLSLAEMVKLKCVKTMMAYKEEISNQTTSN
ncbi:hypothetical protein CHUAL_001037 [Chamberlinius hualienensis]